MRKLFLCFAFACLLPAAATAGPRNQGYKQLGADEIRLAFSGRIFAQPGKPAMRFTPEGQVEGAKDARAWRVIDDTLCLSGAEQTCFDVWQKGRDIQMFAGDNDFSLAGVLQ